MTYSKGQECGPNAYDHEQVSALVDRQLPYILRAGAGAITLDPLLDVGRFGPDSVLWESQEELVGYEVGPMPALSTKNQEAVAEKGFDPAADNAEVVWTVRGVRCQRTEATGGWSTGSTGTHLFAYQDAASSVWKVLRKRMGGSGNADWAGQWLPVSHRLDRRERTAIDCIAAETHALYDLAMTLGENEAAYTALQKELLQRRNGLGTIDRMFMDAIISSRGCKAFPPLYSWSFRPSIFTAPGSFAKPLARRLASQAAGVSA
jgi:hypothetical protein